MNSAAAECVLSPPFNDLSLLPQRRLKDMERAADELYALLLKFDAEGTHPVADVLAAANTAFATFTHYPETGVGDSEDRGAWYYHAHDPTIDRPWEEHGHFHCFSLVDSLAPNAKPWAAPANPRTDNRCPAHLVALCVSATGAPKHLFTLNRWASDDYLYPAETMIPLIDRFEITHDARFSGTSKWLSAMLRVLHPQISWLLYERDRVLRAAQFQDVQNFSENPSIEVTSMLTLEMDEHLEALDRALTRCS